jgi:hypothetical protein
MNVRLVRALTGVIAVRVEGRNGTMTSAVAPNGDGSFRIMSKVNDGDYIRSHDRQSGTDAKKRNEDDVRIKNAQVIFKYNMTQATSNITIESL